ncbi:MAG: hypothetical protein AAGD25_19815 [Cyanobacteria bacterium P01_F01_bin.150]
MNTELGFTLNVEGLDQGDYYFEQDGNNKLIKLGDGTFGIVFAAKSKTHPSKKLAVKIFYEPLPSTEIKIIRKLEENLNSKTDSGFTNIVTNSAETRFQAEIKSARLISDNLSKKECDSGFTHPAGVVEVLGGTDSFYSSEAYLALEHEFTGYGISQYALVMERYEKTLKQLLEENVSSCNRYTVPSSDDALRVFVKEIPVLSKDALEKCIEDAVTESKIDSDVAHSLKESIYELTGYDILCRMNFNDRIATILSFIDGIASGIKTIHQADYFHLDLKPANIFIRNFDDEVKTAVGDLGFFDIQEENPLNFFDVSNRETLPLGTRHYRSPEQKDYFDIADAEIRVCDGEESSIKLFIRDPKFKDSIIEAGDSVFLNKVKGVCLIKEIKYNDFQGGFANFKKNAPVEVLLTCPPRIYEKIESDNRTQVIFFKKQRHRTDLFGFGAILFDLITCGESPELFYDSIRRYDVRTGDVQGIINSYVSVANFQSSDPGIVQIFEPFKLKFSPSEYAPREIVEIILRCMLYQCKGTYYREMPKKDVSSHILQYLRSLFAGQTPRFRNHRFVDQNVLWRGEIPKQSGSPIDSFEKKLKDLCKLSEKDFPERLVQGIYYLGKLEKLVREVRDRPSNTTYAFFAEISPNNLIFKNDSDKKLSFKYVLYKDEADYQRDLKNDSLYTKIGRTSGNPYVPYSFLNIRRTIHISQKSKNGTDKDPSVFHFQYEFIDASPYGDSIESKDWIVFGRKKKLLKVERIDTLKKSIFCQLCSGEDEYESFQESDFNESLIFYKNIDPCVYYLEMLGNYLYHIFFVGMENNSLSQPSFVQTLRTLDDNSICCRPVEDFTSGIPLPGWIRQNDTHRKLARKLKLILSKLASMYFKLVFVNSHDSYYSSYSSIRERYLQVAHDIAEIKQEIALLLDVDPLDIDDQKVDFKNKNLPRLIGNYERDIQLDFNKLLRSQVLFRSAYNEWVDCEF